MIVRLMVLLLGIAFAAPLVARAQSDPEAEARERFAEGQRLVDAGRYAEASASFRRGYELSRRPLFLFNIAECARQSGDARGAIDLYERYVREDPDGPMADTARARGAELRRTLPPDRGSSTGPETSGAATSGDAASADGPAPARVHLGLAQTEPEGDRPLVARWPFWAVVGGVVAAGLLATLVGVLVSDAQPSCDAGCVRFGR